MPFCRGEIDRPAAQNSVDERVRRDAQKVTPMVTASTAPNTISGSALTVIAGPAPSPSRRAARGRARAGPQRSRVHGPGRALGQGIEATRRDADVQPADDPGEDDDAERPGVADGEALVDRRPREAAGDGAADQGG